MAYPQSLSITNPGAETGDMTGWTASVAGWRTSTSRAHSGTYSFEGGIGSATPISYQDIAIPAGCYTDVDAGLIKAVLTFWQNDYSGDTDSAWMQMDARTTGGSTLATKSSPAKGDCNETAVQTTLFLWLPPNTRTIRLYLKGNRVTGAGLSAHIDDIVLNLTLPANGTVYGVAGCDLWLKGEDITGANADPISSWADASGSAEAAALASSGSYRPTKRSAGTPGLNDLPTARGDGSDDLFTDSNNALKYAGKTGMTIFAVAEINPVDNANNNDVISRMDTADRGFRLCIGGAASPVFFQIASSSSARTQRNWDAYQSFLGCPVLVRARYNGATGEMSIWINGINRDGSIDASVPACIANDGTTLKVMGTDYTGGSHPRMKGDLAELLVFGKALSDDDCETIEAELIDKYKLYILDETAVSSDINCHQGIANDGTDNYGFHTDAIRKFDASWSLLSQNTSIFTGFPATTIHCTDGDYFNGKLYVELDIWPGTSGDMFIAVFNATTLALITSVNIGSVTLNCSCIDPINGIFYGLSATHLYSWNIADLSYIGSVALSKNWKPQGIAYHSGRLYATIGDDDVSGEVGDGLVVEIDPDTGVVRPIFRITTTTQSEEGCDFFGDTFRWLIDASGSEVVHSYSFTSPWPPVSGEPTEVRQDRLDISGNSKHLEDIGTVPTGDVPGKIGNAAYFSGTGQQQLYRNTAPDLSSDIYFTVAFRVKPHRKANPASPIYWRFTIGDLEIKVGFNPGEVDAFVSVDTPSLSCVTGDVVWADAWSLVIVYFNGTGLYIIIDDSEEASDLGASTGIVTPAVDIEMGIDAAIDMAITIDEVGIWVDANALSPSERAVLYNGNYGQRPSFAT